MASSNASQETVLPIFTVDAFTREAFKGNGAAVCLLRYQQVLPDDVMQKIAAEMNLSETVFISILGEKDTFETGVRFGLRWFTPTCEVSLCGHATLAAAAVLFKVHGNPSPSLTFETLSGELSASWTGDGVQIELPTYAYAKVSTEEYRDVIRAAVGDLGVADAVLSESGKLLIRLKDDVPRSDFLCLRPLPSALVSGAPHLRGAIVTMKGEDGADDYDFVSRYFAPWLGVNEDPVTGSAHSVLAPYWSEVLSRDTFRARQCSSRGGELEVRLSEGGRRVLLTGGAVVVLRGSISLIAPQQ